MEASLDDHSVYSNWSHEEKEIKAQSERTREKKASLTLGHPADRKDITYTLQATAKYTTDQAIKSTVPKYGQIGRW